MGGFYLAFHHDKLRLIFEVQPGAPRSPSFAYTLADKTSQTAHRRRIEASGGHPSPFQDQGDVARKSMRSFLHFRVDPTIDPIEPAADALVEAWKHREEIVQHLNQAIKKPDPRAVPITDPANSAAFVAAVRSAAERWQVNLATIVDIAARYEEQIRAAAESCPTPETLYDQAFAELALGDYTASFFSDRRAANLALVLRQKQPIDVHFHLEAALNALLFTPEVAKAAHDTSAATLEEAGTLVDKEAAPLLWVEIHEPLADFLLEHAKLDRADDLISDIIDIREERQGEYHPDLTGTLILWTKLLYARANYCDMESVAIRAERIYTYQNPPHFFGFVSALNSHALALHKEGRIAEAEQLYERVLTIREKALGPEHPGLATSLNNLAQLYCARGRYEQSEPLFERALTIREKALSPEHPDVAQSLNNLALFYRARGQYGQNLSPLFERALTIWETALGPEHPYVANEPQQLGDALLQPRPIREGGAALPARAGDSGKSSPQP